MGWDQRNRDQPEAALRKLVYLNLKGRNTGKPCIIVSSSRTSGNQVKVRVEIKEGNAKNKRNPKCDSRKNQTLILNEPSWKPTSFASWKRWVSWREASFKELSWSRITTVQVSRCPYRGVEHLTARKNRSYSPSRTSLFPLFSLCFWQNIDTCLNLYISMYMRPSTCTANCRY